MIRDKLAVINREKDDPAELHRAIRKATTSKDGNVFDAVGERTSDALLRESEESMMKEKSMVVKSSQHQQPVIATKVFDHVSRFFIALI